MVTEDKGLKGWLRGGKNKTKQKTVETACLPLKFRNECTEGSQAVLGSQDTPKHQLPPAGFPISVTDGVIHLVVQTGNLGLIPDFCLHPKVYLVTKPCCIYFLNMS